MMTEEQRRFEQWASGIYDTRLLKDEKGNYRGQVLQRLWQAWQTALTQPASPALKLPDLKAAEEVFRCLYSGRALSAAINAAKWYEEEAKRRNVPHTAPIEPICATGGAEWTGNSLANDALIMLGRIDTSDSADDDRIEEVKRIIRLLAAVPEA